MAMTTVSRLCTVLALNSLAERKGSLFCYKLIQKINQEIFQDNRINVGPNILSKPTPRHLGAYWRQCDRLSEEIYLKTVSVSLQWESA